MINYYQILGLSPQATESEIRRAYRKLARKNHPDVNQNDKNAEDLFKKINEAYQILSDSNTRSKYDRYGDNWKSAERYQETYRSPQHAAGQWPFNLNDLSSFFTSENHNRRRYNSSTSSDRPNDSAYIERPVTITLEEAFYGTTRRVEFPALYAEGVPRRMEVQIPPGATSETKVHIPLGDGLEQDLYLKISVLPHAIFDRKGPNLSTKVKVPLVDAVLGGEVVVSALTGPISLKIPAGIDSGQALRLSRQGMPHLNDPTVRGDMDVIVDVEIPKHITQEQRSIFEQLRGLTS